MADRTAIGWTEATWNPVTGCDRVSPGCDHCYALTLAARLKKMGSPAYQLDGDPRTSGPGFAVQTHPERLDQPLKWQRPRMIFTNSMSDLFHPKIPAKFIADTFAVMGLAGWHTFQVLTKRAPRMRALLRSAEFGGMVAYRMAQMVQTPGTALRSGLREQLATGVLPFPTLPLPNVWLGVSAEDAKRARARVPVLADTPAAVRWVSAEPLLGPVADALDPWLGCPDYCTDRLGIMEPYAGCCPAHNGVPIDWLVVGGESGHGCRPMHPDWPRDLRDRCRAGGVAFYFKQHGGWVETPADVEPGRGARLIHPDGRSWYDDEPFPPWKRAEGHAVDHPGVRKVRYAGPVPTSGGRDLDGRTHDDYPEVPR